MKTKKIIGWVLAVLGLISYVMGFIIMPQAMQVQDVAQMYNDEQKAIALAGWSILAMIGRILFAIAIAFFASAKGRNWLWGLLGLVPLFGIIAISVLKSKNDEPVGPKEKPMYEPPVPGKNLWNE